MSKRTIDIHEAISLQEAQVDADEGWVRNVRLITAGWSSNDRYYPAETLEAAAPLWDGVVAYANHPTPQEIKDGTARRVEETVGRYANARQDGAYTVADLKVVGQARDWVLPLIQETLESGVPLIGLSINALGTSVMGEAEGRKGPIIEAITHANSVDVVSTPAAGGGFDAAQLMMSDNGWTRAVLENVSLEEVRDARPDLIAALKKEWKTVRDSAALAEATAKKEEAQKRAERDRQEKRALREQLVAMERAMKGFQVDSLLASVALPAVWAQDVRALLMEAETSEWASIMEREMAKVKGVKGQVAVRGAGRLAAPQVERQQAAAGGPVTEALGLKLDSHAPRANESYSEWIERTRR